MITEKFDPKKQHNYVRANINGHWHSVSHFAKRGEHWECWVSGYGFIELQIVLEWEVVED